jgi:CDP-diacylglycerol--glycerol-3-phosphate 3-phosphatidyltransferase
MGWANWITVARALLTAGLWALIAATTPAPAPWAWWTAFALFVVTATTDAVDGMVARRLGEVSAFGRIADPLVDKLLVLGTMVVLLGVAGVPAVLPPWAVTAMFSRELLVTALRGAVEGKGISFGAIGMGKTKMVIQCVALGAVLLHGAGVPPFHQVALPLGVVLLATAVTAVSAIPYVLRAVAALKA